MNRQVNRPKYRLAYIAGAGHCGSTLLNLLLNAHSKIFGMSEITSIGDHVPGSPASAVLEDPFWRAVARRYEKSSGSAFLDLDLEIWPAARILRPDPVAVDHWAGPNRDLLDCVALESEATILVDASKSWQRLALLAKSEAFDLRVIHLLRDGRAVYNSYNQKYQRPIFALTKWPKFTLAALALRRSFAETPWLDLRYENLATDPAGALADVCAFLGVDFEPSMLRYREPRNLGLGGNRMAAGSGETIQLDERWRTELSAAHRLAFGVIFGWLNYLLGYR